MSFCHVITTVSKPTAIECATKGSFLDPVKENIILWYMSARVYVKRLYSSPP